MACPQSARKNILCRGFKQGPPRLQTYNPCHQRGISVVSTSDDWNNAWANFPLCQGSQAYFDCLLFKRHADMEKWRKMVIFHTSGELPVRQFCLPTSAERYSEARQPRHLHQNASFSSFSFTCSSLMKVQQKFPHVKGWAVKKFTRVMFHKGQPVTQHWTGKAYSIFSQAVSC